MRRGGTYNMNNGFCASSRAHARHSGRRRGFTLVEMMVAIALVIILLAVALPSFVSLVEKYRVEGMASALTASVGHARFEAARRGKTVTIRARPGCVDKGWSCGWDTLVGSGDAVETLRRQEPDARVEVRKTVPGVMSFDAMGDSDGGDSFRLYPTGKAGSSRAVMLCVSRAGRLRVAKGRDKC